MSKTQKYAYGNIHVRVCVKLMEYIHISALLFSYICFTSRLYIIFYGIYCLGSQHRNCENWVFLPVCEIPVIWVQISPQNLSSGFCQIYSSDTGRHTCFFHTAEGKKHSKRITCCFIAEPHRPIKVPQNNSSAHDSGACFLK